MITAIYKISLIDPRGYTKRGSSKKNNFLSLYFEPDTTITHLPSLVWTFAELSVCYEPHDWHEVNNKMASTAGQLTSSVATVAVRRFEPVRSTGRSKFYLW